MDPLLLQAVSCCVTVFPSHMLTLRLRQLTDLCDTCPLYGWCIGALAIAVGHLRAVRRCEWGRLPFVDRRHCTSLLSPVLFHVMWQFSFACGCILIRINVVKGRRPHALPSSAVVPDSSRQCLLSFLSHLQLNKNEGRSVRRSRRRRRRAHGCVRLLDDQARQVLLFQGGDDHAP